MQTFKLDSLQEIHFELSSHCNAHCPQCTRNINGGLENPYFRKEHLNLQSIKKMLPESLPEQLRQVFFCGSYGEPVMNPEFIEIAQFFRQANPKIFMLMHTNGSLRPSAWWRDLAQVFSPGRIDFAIDGLSDTYDFHRRGLSFEKLLKNAKAFIDAGGRAQWTFLVFKHNEHQLKEAQQMAQDLGFARFVVSKSGRFFDQRNYQVMPQWKIDTKNSPKSRLPGDTLEMATDEQNQNPSFLKLNHIKKQYGDFENYLDQTPIECDALKLNKIYVTSNGYALPCGLLNENLFDARFFEPDIDPGVPSVAQKQFADLIEKNGGLRSLRATEIGLVQAMQSPVWQAVQDSWDKKSMKEGRLFECALTCGQGFNKCWDQKENVVSFR